MNRQRVTVSDDITIHYTAGRTIVITMYCDEIEITEAELQAIVMFARTQGMSIT